MRCLACVVVLLDLLAAGLGCGDVEVRGRLVASAGPSYAGGEYRFWDPLGSWQDSFAEGTIGTDGSFSGMVPEGALRAGSVELLLDKGGTSFQLEVEGFPDAVPDHVDLGDLVLWNPGLHLDRGDDGVIVHWTPPPDPVAASAEFSIAGIELDPNVATTSVPAYLIEDRHAAIFVAWEPAIQSSHLRVMASAARVEAAPYSPSAAAGAPCFAYRVDPEQGERTAALVDPCVLTDRYDSTWFDLDTIPADDGDTRGVVVDLGATLAVSKIVVRTRESAPAARVLVAANDEPPQLVGVLSAPVTGLELATPVMASKIFVESEEPAVVVDVAAFANDEMP